MTAMKSPFPGMDPYLEARWLDLHTRFIVAARSSIQRQLPDELLANIQGRTVDDDTFGYHRRIDPNARMPEVLPSITSEAGGAAVVTLTQPLRLTEMSEPITERFIEIVDLSTGGRVITVIEFVSPTNKLPGDGLKQYKQKQEECFNAKVSLVEIDLTRGERTLLAHRWATARRYESTYQISIWNSASWSQVDLYPISLCHRLPIISIPLRPSDPPATVDLQAVLDE